jgi:hypothetical protein
VSCLNDFRRYDNLIGNDSNLNRRRYAQNDDTLYVAPEDERTDYVRHMHFSSSLLTISLVATSDGKLV